MIPTMTSAEEFKGDNFTIDLPNKPKATKKVEMPKSKTSYAWVYQGEFDASDNINISYSIEAGHIGMDLIKDISPNEVAAEMVKIAVSAAGPNAKPLAMQELKPKEVKGGVGYEIWYGSELGVFVTKVIVVKPKLWLVNIIGLSKSKEELELMKKIIDSLKVIPGGVVSKHLPKFYFSSVVPVNN